MNPILLQSYQVGVGIGVIVLSTLILFPGTKNKLDDTTTTTVDDTTTALVTPIRVSNSSPITVSVSNENKEISFPDPVPDPKLQKDMINDTDIPNFLSPHRRMNWTVYMFIYVVISLILFYCYSASTSETQDDIPLYRRQLQSPTKLLQLTFEAYFPKESSVLFAQKKVKKSD